ncbi:hypothetical protein B0I35DRAFT_480817 [Stachybotrys elegans]|uniref:BHLH domain-containing protein n=1 Tax=Stachybotrys elegans TaxID=80388 RepID=A0A8K0SKN9_9HYPO|nr:hypothetical protein B0I35DRAFT_480817 [Stachybotrys elegans]
MDTSQEVLQSSGYQFLGSGPDNGRTETTTAPMGASANPNGPSSASTTDISFTQAPVPSPYMRGKALNPQATSQQMAQSRDRHDQKRVKMDMESDTPALDSIDYWIQFDDDDVDNWGSFEIDFSKLNDTTLNRPDTRAETVPGLGTGLYTQPSMPVVPEEYLDDAAFEGSLSDDEDNFESLNLRSQLPSSDVFPPSEVPPREGLYSTPLSWERPQLGLPAGVNASASASASGSTAELPRRPSENVDFPLPQPGTMALSAAERRRLIAIAMNVSQAPASFMPSTGFGLGFGAGLDYNKSSSDDASPGSGFSKPGQKKGGSESMDSTREPSDSKGKHPAKRPNFSRNNTNDKTKDKGKSADRLAHNDIERKYRTNLKDKIAELRDAVPNLRDSNSGDDEGSGNQGTAKLSKGTILMKATEYIQQLERRNKSIIKEQQQLARRLQAFETLLNATATQSFAVPKHSGALFDPRGFC